MLTKECLDELDVLGHKDRREWLASESKPSLPLRPDVTRYADKEYAFPLSC
jgi:hypothetical protein